MTVHSNPSERGHRRLLLAGSLLVAAGLIVRMLGSSYLELRQARQAAQREDISGQIKHLRRAMAYYIPGNPWVRTAKERLLGLAYHAESKGDTALALVAYRELRSAILSLRGFIHPHKEDLPQINEAIVRLSLSGTKRDTHQQAQLRARLDNPPEPHFGWAFLGLLGFLLWVVGALAMLWRGLRPSATIHARRFWPLLAVVAIGFSFFFLGMSYA